MNSGVLYKMYEPTFMVQWYEKTFGHGLQIINGRIEGMWLLGNSYGNRTEYHGAFPGNWLKRVLCMYPHDGLRVLHLFSGSLPPGNYTRFDRRTDLGDGPDVVGEAENLSDYFDPDSFDLIIADPPYTGEDAEHYGTILCNRKKVIEECRKVLAPGGHLVWLDQVWPMYRKDEWDLLAMIGVCISTNHRARFTVIWRKR